MKLTKLVIILLLLAPITVAAHGEETFAQAEQIIEQKISCEELSEEQLEILGDYYMEQMHPGDAHTEMDEMMGGEGSESLRLIHIRMAESFYCGDHERFSGGMMNTMMGRDNMMNGEIPTCTDEGCTLNNSYVRGNMMNGYGMNYGMGAWWLVYVIIGSAVFGLVFWGTYKLIIKK